MTHTARNFLPTSYAGAVFNHPRDHSSLLFQAEARWRLPLQVALRAEAHARVRSTPADQVHPRGLRHHNARTVHLLQPAPDYALVFIFQGGRQAMYGLSALLTISFLFPRDEFIRQPLE
jgi:hypothetical protein